MKHHTYNTFGTCSAMIEFDIDDQQLLHNVRFVGGCNGNLQGIGRLVEGQSAAEVASRLQGVSCNGSPTSCPDQLARAIAQCLGQ